MKYENADDKMTRATDGGKKRPSNSLPQDLHFECRAVLLNCDEFESNQRLQTIFATSELKPYKDRLPKASNRSELIDGVLSYLLDQQLADGRFVLPLFFEALCVLYDANDMRRVQLRELTYKVQAVLRPSTHAESDDDLSQRRRFDTQQPAALQLGISSPGKLVGHVNTETALPDALQGAARDINTALGSLEGCRLDDDLVYPVRSLVAIVWELLDAVEQYLIRHAPGGYEAGEYLSQVQRDLGDFDEVLADAATDHSDANVVMSQGRGVVAVLRTLANMLTPR